MSKTVRKKSVMVRVRGRISTVYLRRGQEVEVVMTRSLQRLIDAGWIEEVDAS